MNQLMLIAEDYFRYLGQNFPVLCLSDEFYFFPRAKCATRFLNFLDCLDEQKIKQCVHYVKNLKSSLENITVQNLDEQIDVTLLNQSMSTFLREFGENKIWQSDPTLYLKIILLGMQQLLGSFSFLKSDFGDNLHSRMSQIPRLLKEARSNLRKVALPYLETACELIGVAIDYFKSAKFPFKNKSILLQALEDFRKFLLKRPVHKAYLKDKRFLQTLISESFSYKRSLQEIFAIASEEYHQSLKQLAQLAREIKPDESWQEILSGYRVAVKNKQELLELYAGQIQRLKRFLKKKGVVTISGVQNVLVKSTPAFLQPIRASASYASPITTDRREPAYFYISSAAVKSNIHQEYIFITAHETYPGHHLLDSIRRSLDSPIRRQIESVLFYEGWAAYAEKLIVELGYIENPLQKLVGLKRQAWRAIRAMLDVGVSINKLTLEEGAKLLQGLGYAASTVKAMLRHYLLSPGYQLCYTLGKFEIERIKGRFSAQLGLERFHNLLLHSGQIPFALLERRMEEYLCRRNL